MKDTDAATAGLDPWTAALKRREELQDLLRGVHALVQEGSIKTSSLDEIRKLLAAAQKEVDRLESQGRGMQDPHAGQHRAGTAELQDASCRAPDVSTPLQRL